jgi:hypothetical protein
MASTFPGAIDSFTDPLSGSALNSPSHSAQHADLNDAAEKIETYMGLVKVVPTSVTGGTLSATGTVTIGSARSSVVINGAFSSLYEDYRVVVSGVAVSAPNNSSYALISSSVGATYSANGIYMIPTSATVNGLAQNQQTTGFWLGITGGTWSATFDICNPFLATATNVVGQSAGSGATSYYNTFMGADSNAASSTGLAFVQQTSTWTGGTIAIYGYRI